MQELCKVEHNFSREVLLSASYELENWCYYYYYLLELLKASWWLMDTHFFICVHNWSVYSPKSLAYSPVAIMSIQREANVLGGYLFSCSSATL